MKNIKNGFTLLELLVALTIVSVILTFAVPSFYSMLQRNKLNAATQSFSDDIRHTRTLAIKQSRNTTLSLTRTSSGAGDWCYGITVKNVCNCITANDCEIKTVSGGQFNTTSTDTSANITFDFRRGTTQSENQILFSTNDYQAKVIISEVGRVTKQPSSL